MEKHVTPMFLIASLFARFMKSESFQKCLMYPSEPAFILT